MANLDQNYLANQDNMPRMALRTTPVPKVKHLHHNTGTPLITKKSPTWGTHGCVTLPDLLPGPFCPQSHCTTSLLDCPIQRNDATHRPTRTHSMPQTTGPLNPPAYLANDSTPKQQDHSDNLTGKVGLPTPKSRQTSKQTSRSKDEHRYLVGHPELS